ncbi:MAG: transcription antitermination factor NusB [Bifidobacteriaceae bacterium]|nr:transcription antitermination factor NusB [Bifidobacteriaceae bacterium]
MTSEAVQASGGGGRAAARQRALELLFEADQRGVDLLELLESRLASPELGGPVPAFTEALVRGVAEHREQIGEWLDTYSHGWTQDRMAAVDRAILYLGAYEVVWEDDVPDPVVLQAAADLAGSLSTDKSANFVSGVLGRLSDLKETLL